MGVDPKGHGLDKMFQLDRNVFYQTYSRILLGTHHCLEESWMLLGSNFYQSIVEQWKNPQIVNYCSKYQHDSKYLAGKGLGVAIVSDYGPSHY